METYTSFGPASFSYTAITNRYDSFRLLRLLPGQTGEEPIRCEIFNASISDKAGTYVAGSYTWGSTARSGSIILNNFPFYIRENLLDFFRMIRSDHEQVIIWVDAICIDQSNSSERTHQVGMMARIYGNASAVAIWMGHSSKELYRSMDIICKLGTDKRNHIDPHHGRSMPVADGDEHSQTVMVTPFFNLPWWFRIWTVQEYALAKRRVFYCGDRIIEGRIIDNYARNVRFHNTYCCSDIMWGWRPENLKVTMQDSVHNLEMLKSYDDGEMPPFLQTIGRFEFRGATDARDKIYGLLGIFEDQSQHFLEAKYDRTPQQVCMALIESWVAHYNTFDFLEHVADYTAFPTQTFVPNWTEARPLDHERWESDRRWRMRAVYDASAGRSADWIIDALGGATCTGSLIDTIVSTTTAEWRAFTEVFREAQDILNLKDRLEEVYEPTGQSMHDAFLLTMSGGLQFEGNDPESKHMIKRDDIDEHFNNWVEYMNCNVTLNFVPRGPQEHQTSINSILAFFRALVYGRRFVVTEKGYFGFAPWSSKPGDLVAVVFGCRSPCILRPVGNQPDSVEERNVSEFKCKMLDTSYIHGAMDGECVRDKTREKLATQKIYIV